MSLRIIHGADLHLDTPFDALGAEKAARRRAEQRQLLTALVREVRGRGADLLLLSGDILDTASACAETGEQLAAALREVKIPVFIAPGNHDWVSRRSPYMRLSFSDNVHIFTVPEIRRVALPELCVNVYGAGYTSNACPPLLERFHAERRPGWRNLLTLHAEVGRPASPYCPVTVEQLAQSGLDYAAFGHVHTCSGLRRAGETFYGWPGCTEGRGFDECGEKGVLQIDLDESGCRAAFLPLGRRQYRVLTATVEAAEKDGFLSDLPGDARNHIYKIVLTGERDALPDLAALRDRLEPLFFSLTLAAATVPRRELWARAEEDTLTGAFLRRMRRRMEAASTEEERRILTDAVRLGLAALEDREAPL